VVIRVPRTAFATAAVIALISPLPASGISNRAAAPPVTCLGRAATIAGTQGDDALHGTPGDDVIAARDGLDRVWGGGGDDVICGDMGRDKIFGGAGDDLIDGGGRADTLVGGPGFNTLIGGGAPTPTNLSPWHPDTVRYGWSRSPLSADLRTGRAQTDQSDDVLADVAGVVGTRGRDVMDGSKQIRVWLDGGAGPDVLRAGTAGAFLEGGPGDDLLLGSDGDDALFGRVGDDTLRGRLGDDLYFGGKGADIERDSGGASHVIGDLGANVISLADGDDDVELIQLGRSVVHTGDGDDHVLTAHSSVFTGPGDDHVEVGQRSTDMSKPVIDLRTGPGEDTIDFYARRMPRRFSVDAGHGFDSFLNFGDMDNVSTLTFEVSLGPHGAFSQPFEGPLESVENYASFAYGAASLVTGSESNDVIHVEGTGHDRVWGLGGDDEIFLYNAASTGIDGAIDGGDGFDTCSDAAAQLNCEDDL
jgi:Ca2+-binding RTX toxin-like protein